MSLIQHCLLIECVRDEINESDICKEFHSRNIGLVHKIVWKPRTDITKMCAVFFRLWYDTAAASQLRGHIFDGAVMPFVYKTGPFDSGSIWNIRKLTESEFGVWQYPLLRHVDLEVLIDAHVMHESVEDMIDHLRLGKVLKISRNWTGGAKNPRENLLEGLPKDPRDMIFPDMHENERVRIQFKCWNPTPEAAKFQYLLFNAALDFERDHGVVLMPPSSEHYVRVQVSDELVLKLYAREALQKATIKHEETFVWLNPVFNSECISNQVNVASAAPALPVPANAVADAPVSVSTEDIDAEEAGSADIAAIDLPDLLKMISVERKPHGRPEDIPNFLKTIED